MMNAPYLTLSHIRWLIFIFGATILPHSLHFPIWITVFALSCMLWRLNQSRCGGAVPHVLIRLVLVGLGILCIVIQFNTIIGKDAAVSFLILMLGLKLLEIKARRDVQFFIFLNYFVIMSNFFYSQSFWLATYMLVIVWLNTAVLSYSNRRGSTAIHEHDLKLSLNIMLQALPVFLIIFILFPRIEGPFLKLPGENSIAKTGLSDRMQPGDISRLIRSQEIAFRAEFDAAAPDKRHLYWRGPVLSRFDGSAWVRDPSLLPHTGSVPSSTGFATTYKISLEPTGNNYLPTLDYPIHAPMDAWIDEEQVTYSRSPVNTRLSYRLYSRNNLAHTMASNKQLEKYRTHPRSTNPRTQSLVLTLRARSKDDGDFVKQVLHYFTTENFSYTLSPTLLGKHAVDDFLFNTKKGFCEHYSNAFVVLMRYAGIPARVVTGYQGGEYNPVGNYYVVRQSDAHAWNEIWLKDSGWIRIDPTAHIAPERVERGIEASLPHLISWRSHSLNYAPAWLTQLNFRLDALHNSWNQLVLGYSQENQAKFLAQFGLVKSQSLTLWVLMIVLTLAVVIAFAYLRYRKQTRPQTSEVDMLFITFCKMLKKIGIEHDSWEGAYAFYQRIVTPLNQFTTETSQHIKSIFDLYVKLKYVDNKDHEALAALRLLVRNFQPSQKSGA